MRLLVAGVTVPVVQLGPDFLLLAAPVEMPAGDACVVMQVDAEERLWNVHLPDGISAASRRVAIAMRP